LIGQVVVTTLKIKRSAIIGHSGLISF